MQDSEMIKVHRDTLSAGKAEMNQWLDLWRDLNSAFYPFIYSSLLGTTSLTGGKIRNTKMLDGEPAQALLVLSAGFYNGVTSPARKWVNVKRPGALAYEEPTGETITVHTQTRDKILEVLAGSNYYDTRAMQVYDGCGLGTGVLLCYEDRDYVCSFTVCPPGAYHLHTDSKNRVTKFSREFKMKATDLLEEFGKEALPASIIERAEKGGAQGRTEYLVSHLIEANDNTKFMAARSAFRELYWLSAPQANAPTYLAKRPLYEWPAAVLRWSCPDGSTYGIPPTLTVLGKAIQLQNLEYKSDQGLDKLISPPLLADHQLKNRPKAFQAGGITFTNNLSPNSGARPVYQVTIPFQEMDFKRSQIVSAIKEGLYNPLFDIISQLDTVRSATEIDALREERLTLLGPVLHRGYVEDIGVIVKRVYGICKRKGLLPEIPSGEGADIEFRNILSDVQKASDVATIERFTAYCGQVIPVFPDVQASVDGVDLLRQYAEGLGIKPTTLRPTEDVNAANDQGAQMQELAATAGIAKDFGAAASGLGGLDVGGGMNAVQSLL